MNKNKSAFLIDSHAHLSYYNSSEIEDVFKDCINDNILMIQNVSTCANSFNDIFLGKDFKYNEHLCYSIGTHPCTNVNYNLINVINDTIKSFSSYIVSIGECGLDFYREKKENVYPLQKKVFEEQIGLSIEHNLPLIVHSRDAEKETYEMLKSDSNAQGVIHCFTGTKEFIKKCLDLGFYISFSGIVTFRNCQLKELLEYCPLDRMLIETDSPYLAPQKHRGKQNRPNFVKEVLLFISEYLKMESDDVASKTTSNFFNLFQKARKGR